MILEELSVALGWKLFGAADLQRFEAGLRRVGSALNTFRTVAAVGGTAIAGFGALAASAGAVAIAAIGPKLGRAALETGMEFEKLRTTLEVLEGSSEKAKSSLDWVADFAEKTPFDLQGVADAFVKMRAYGLDPMDGSLKTIGDTAAAMQKPLKQGVEAVADAITGEYVRLKEFAGLTVDATGKDLVLKWQENGEDMTKTVRKSGAEVVKALNEIWGRRFGGSMEKASRTLESQLDRVKERWKGFLRDIAGEGEKGSLFEFVRDEMLGLNRVLDNPAMKARFKGWAQSIGQGMKASLITAGEGAIWLADRFRENQPAIERFGKSLRETAGVTWADTKRELAGINEFLSQPQFSWGANTAREIETVQTAITGLGAALVSAFPSELNFGANFARELNTAETAFRGLDELFRQTETSLGEGFLAGLKTVGPTLESFFTGLKEKIRGNFAPSEFNTIGSLAMLALRTGFATGGDQLIATAAKIAGDVKSAFQSALAGIHVELPALGSVQEQRVSPTGTPKQNDPAERYGPTGPRTPTPVPRKPHEASPEMPAVKRGASLRMPGSDGLRGLKPAQTTQMASVSNNVSVTIQGSAKEADVRRGVASGLKDAGVGNPTRNLFFNTDSPVTA